jgi:hypothetical protein
VAPGNDFALAETLGGGLAILYLKGGAIDHTLSIPGALAALDWVAFSPVGRSAVLYSSSANRLQVLTSLPDNPRLIADVDASTLPDTPVRGAVSDQSAGFLVASTNAVRLIKPTGTIQLVLSLGEITSLSMLQDRTDAIVSDGSTGSIYLLTNLDSSPTVRLVASGLSGIGRTYPAWDGQAVYVAQGETKTVSVVNLASGDVRGFPTPVAPVRLTPLRYRGMFLISAEPDQPGWIFFLDSNNLGRAVGIRSDNRSANNFE